MVENLFEYLDHKKEDLEEWEVKIKNRTEELKIDYENGIEAAVYEALAMCLNMDREWYGNGAKESWDYTRLPTWAIEAALPMLRLYFLKLQSNGRGRNSKQLAQFDQDGADANIWFNITMYQEKMGLSLETACEALSEHISKSPDAIKKAYYRHQKNGFKFPGYQYFGYFRE